MAVSIVLSHISALLVAVLVLLWALAFRTTIFLRFYSSSVDGGATATATAVAHFDHLYFVLHTLLMVIGFILFGGEGILVHRWGWAWVGHGARGRQRTSGCRGAALGFGVAGVWTKFKGNKGVLANFHSLHSWMGLLCLLLFAAQWTMGFLSFWTRGEGRRARTLLLPWHIFIGIFTYSLAVATAESGLMEKMAFLHTKHGIPGSSLEFTLINVLGLTLAIHCGLVVFTLIPTKHKESSTSTMTTRIGYGVSGVQRMSL